ncbi:MULTISPECIES: hypothetical protein [unclassified Enterococcus]|uniref:hypothetical protein n=1 Tax=unclassified Enterococcus TaxID=2608891 RepID=UPI0015565118|nr:MULTISPECIES: hypothetical protein [unclassified Enterococcus]MBS7576031.1 hypothetical protein [Enterococcus sp. MMGLQ5-2]MBS7583264.1 hypothetical protein [Enterococcus sp. MMGLQ5-1]NPD11124.1 hypothetical protein [Enterococcus sp. MMGLQ5-1]NPD35867.1 hypothetical protein [Enterococcus sp. MMGLQ5-2]
MKKRYPVKIYESDNVLYLSERHAFENQRTRTQIKIGYVLIGMADAFKLHNHHPMMQNALRVYTDLETAVKDIPSR